MRHTLSIPNLLRTKSAPRSFGSRANLKGGEQDGTYPAASPLRKSQVQGTKRGGEPRFVLSGVRRFGFNFLLMCTITCEKWGPAEADGPVDSRDLSKVGGAKKKKAEIGGARSGQSTCGDKKAKLDGGAEEGTKYSTRVLHMLLWYAGDICDIMG